MVANGEPVRANMVRVKRGRKQSVNLTAYSSDSDASVGSRPASPPPAKQLRRVERDIVPEPMSDPDFDVDDFMEKSLVDERGPLKYDYDDEPLKLFENSEEEFLATGR